MKKFYPIILVVALAALAVGIIYWQNQGQIALPFEQPASDINKFLDAAPVSTAGWKTYKSSENGFEIKYPVEWQVLNEGKTSYGNIPGFVVQFGTSPELIVTEIEVFETKPGETVTTAFKRITTLDLNTLVKNNIIVGGVAGEYYKNIPGNVPHDKAMLIYKNKLYGLIRYSLKSDMFDSFLSTFMFTD